MSHKVAIASGVVAQLGCTVSEITEMFTAEKCDTHKINVLVTFVVVVAF